MQCKEKLHLIYLIERLTNFTIYHNKPKGRLLKTSKKGQPKQHCQTNLALDNKLVLIHVFCSYNALNKNDNNQAEILRSCAKKFIKIQTVGTVTKMSGT